MRILVNDIAASSGGAKSVLLDFYRFLIESDDKNQWFFLLGEQLIAETENIHVILLPHIKKSWCKRLLFDCAGGKKLVKRIAPDVILSMQNTAMFGTGIPQYIYLHQSLPFQNIKRFRFLKKTERIYAVYQYLIGAFIKLSVRHAQGVFVQTEWMRQAVAKYTDPDRIVVVPPVIAPCEGAEQPHAPMRSDHFFYPANSAVYKNHKTIYEAVRLLTAEGITDFRIDLTLPPTPGSAPQLPQIHCLGTIPREAVMDRYRSSVLLFPSYIETFGLPLAEARQMGGLILAADTPFAREVLDGYGNAWFFDPFDPVQLKDLMKKTMTGQISMRPTEREAPVQNDSWGKMVRHIGR